MPYFTVMILPCLLFLLVIGALAFLHHSMFYEKGSRFVRMIKRWPPGAWFHPFWGLVKCCLIAAFALWLGVVTAPATHWWALLLWPVSDLWFRHLLNKFNDQPWWYMGTAQTDHRAWFDISMHWLMSYKWGKRGPAITAITIEACIAGFAIFKLIQ